MKNKIALGIILIFSAFIFSRTWNEAKEYMELHSANRYFKEGKFDVARKTYEKYPDASSNITKSFYEEKNYDEVIKSKDLPFLKGNSYVYKKDLKLLKKALEEYKVAMLNNDDINIKKNYEIVKKMIADNQKKQDKKQQDKKDKKQNQKQKNQKQNNNQNKQQQNQEKNNQKQQQKNKDKQQNNKQNKDKQNNNQQKDKNKEQNQNKENKKDNKQDKEKQENKQNKKQNQDKENQKDKQNQNKQDKNQENQQDKEKQNKENKQQQNQQDKQNNKKQKNNTAPGSQKDIKPSKEQIKNAEIRAILKRLEGNEKQAFKNNERFMPLGDDKANRW